MTMYINPEVFSRRAVTLRYAVNALEAVKAEALAGTIESRGICTVFGHKVLQAIHVSAPGRAADIRACRDALSEFFEACPHSTGSPSYPVPAPLPWWHLANWFESSRRRAAWRAYYDRSIPSWTGEYGENRMKVLDWVLAAMRTEIARYQEPSAGKKGAV